MNVLSKLTSGPLLEKWTTRARRLAGRIPTKVYEIAFCILAIILVLGLLYALSLPYPTRPIWNLPVA